MYDILSDSRRLVTGIRSGWERVLRLMRTKYHICQQLDVEFGRVSVNTGALLGEASRDARLFCRLQIRYQNGGTFSVQS